MEHCIKWTEEEFKVRYSKEWENLVIITYWEHDFEEGWYLIKYKEKN